MGIASVIASFFGCSPSNTSPQSVPRISNGVEHNQYFTEGAKLIQPYLRLDGAMDKKADTRKASAELERGIILLRAVVIYNPTNWNAFWLMGKAYQTLDNHQEAYDAFSKSYAIQKENPDVAREYMFECLELGKFNEAVTVAEHAVMLEQANAGLHANLALAYTLAGRITDAQSEIGKALQMDSSDQISLALKGRIQQIADGKRPQPRSIRELEAKK